MTAALWIGIALQVAFERMRQDIRVRSYDREVKSAVIGGGGDGGNDDSMESELTLSFLTAVSSGVIVFVNIMLTTAGGVCPITRAFIRSTGGLHRVVDVFCAVRAFDKREMMTSDE